MPSPFSFLREVVRVLSEAGLRMDTSDGYFTKWTFLSARRKVPTLLRVKKVQQNDFILAKVPKHGNFSEGGWTDSCSTNVSAAMLRQFDVMLMKVRNVENVRLKIVSQGKSSTYFDYISHCQRSKKLELRTRITLSSWLSKESSIWIALFIAIYPSCLKQISM